MMIRNRRWDKDDEEDAKWSRLNDGWRDLVIAFASLAGFSLRDQTFTGPAASLTFSVPNNTRPRGVVLVGLYRTDNGATSAVTFSWTYANGEVTTTSFSALAAAEWRATFLVIGSA